MTRRIPLDAGSMGGTGGTTTSPRSAKVRSPAVAVRSVRTRRGASMRTGTRLVHGSSASHQPSWSASTRSQVTEQQRSFPFAAPSSHCSPASTMPFPQSEATAGVPAPDIAHASSTPHPRTAAWRQQSDLLRARTRGRPILHLLRTEDRRALLPSRSSAGEYTARRHRNSRLERFFDRAKGMALLDRLPDMDAGERTAVDGTLMMLLSACVLQQRFALSDPRPCLGS